MINHVFISFSAAQMYYLSYINLGPSLSTGILQIDHFTVVCLVTWPLDGSEARVELVLIQTSLLLLCKTSCSDVNKVHLHDKSREVCIKTGSTLASLPSTGQVAEQTTVKWSIHNLTPTPTWLDSSIGRALPFQACFFQALFRI